MRLLVPHLASVPAWKDFVQATSEVIERHVEDPRRKLSRVRDTVLYRKDDMLKNLQYLEGTITDTETGGKVDLPKGTVIPSAKILVVEQNAPTSKQSGADYLLVEFTLSDKRVFHWKMPVSAPQERSLLIQNGYMLGFDFFNSSFTDEDYRRLVEFISMYWAEGGTDNFIKFISFIKNIKLECLPLWSIDTEDNEYSELEIKQDSMLPTWKGGVWYPTSHVELRFNPLKDHAQTNVSVLDSVGLYKGVEELFYVFAPIHLVLERIVAAIDLYPEFFYASAGQELEQYFGKWEWKYNAGFISDIFMSAGDISEVTIGRIAYSWPTLKSTRSMKSAFQTSQQDFLKFQYTPPDLVHSLGLADGNQTQILWQGGIRYQWPILKGFISGGAVADYSIILNNTATYKIPKLTAGVNHTTVGMAMVYESMPPIKYIPNLIVNGFITNFHAAQMSMFYSSVRGVATYNDFEAYDGVLYPSKRLNAFYCSVVTSEHTIIYAGNDRSTPLNFDVQPILSALVIHILQARVESTRRL